MNQARRLCLSLSDPKGRARLTCQKPPRLVAQCRNTKMRCRQSITSRRLIRGLVEAGMSMIIVTHEVGLAREVADRIVFMDGGTIVEEGAPG